MVAHANVKEEDFLKKIKHRLRRHPTITTIIVTAIRMSTFSDGSAHLLTVSYVEFERLIMN